MGILSELRVYLCGQIENDPEAAGWRRTLTSRLRSIEPTLKVWDPMIKPSWTSPDVMSDVIAFKWKKYIFEDDSDDNLDYEPNRGSRCFDCNKQVRYICKQLAHKCDFMIARISKKFTWGSIHELEIAAERRIPVFLWLPDGPISVYGIAGCVDKYSCMDHYVHFNSDTLLATLQAVNDGSLNIASLDPESWMRLTWVDASELPDE